MSYLAQGLERGFAAGTDMVERKRKRQQDEMLARAERELRLTQQARQIENEKALQEAQQVFGAKQQTERLTAQALQEQKNRRARIKEGERERTWRTGERIDSQGYQSTEAQLADARRAIAQDKELKDRADARDLEFPLRGAQLGLQTRAQDWQESPENPLNRYREVYAKLKADEMGGPEVSFNGGAPSPLGAVGRPQQVNGGRPQMAEGMPRAMTPQDQQAFAWARANPSDPRAKEILKRLGAAQ